MNDMASWFQLGMEVKFRVWNERLL